MDEPAERGESRFVIDDYESPCEMDGGGLLHCTDAFKNLEHFEESVGAAGDPFGEIGGSIWRCHAESMEVIELESGFYIQPLASASMAPPSFPSVIYIDPFSAFGDGRHPSTSLCLRFLAEHADSFTADERAMLSVLDAGAGTGILSIAAEKLGAGLIDAVELHGAAAENARRNVRLNDCVRVTVRQGDLLAVRFGGEYDIVLANLISDVMIACLGVLTPLVRPGGVMIASGIVKARAAEVEERIIDSGLRFRDIALLDGWMGYLLTR
ncbi:MAG TPA: 50S ribosomal protein L11 methyltransferase [Spirochaetota bacterium]|nr:50S ribosomal protein L11 methyltransferase [Spirochaetota bacterium]